MRRDRSHRGLMLAGLLNRGINQEVHLVVPLAWVIGKPLIDDGYELHVRHANNAPIQPHHFALRSAEHRRDEHGVHEPHYIAPLGWRRQLSIGLHGEETILDFYRLSARGRVSAGNVQHTGRDKDDGCRGFHAVRNNTSRLRLRHTYGRLPWP